MNQLLESLIVCPNCKQPFDVKEEAFWRCSKDGFEIPIYEGKPVFTSMPKTAHVYEKIERGPEQGTPWRQANWKFLQEQVQGQDKEALILDVGSGHGDFAQIFTNRKYLAVDIVPYPEVDLACDLGEVVPFKEGTFDLLVLMNVLEHVYHFHKLLDSMFYLLKPGGSLVIAVPFMIKVHQAPFDFYRYTHYTLVDFAKEHGFEVTLLEGYYDPIFFVGESMRNLRFWVLPKLPRFSRWFARGVLMLIESLISLLKLFIGKGYVKSPDLAKNPAAIGYHLVLRKP
ncbi:MAG: class I SAM-dependent methyltransferase [Anaerolineales bacterium]|nr:class I SAM-dependent methyltransferase [Anaerolineales bacterium]